MIVGVDHLLVAVEDLDAASAGFRRGGFEVVVGGEHPAWGTRNALVPLRDGCYIELIAAHDRVLAAASPVTRAVVTALDLANRLASFALESNDLDADVARIRAAGLPIGEPTAGSRRRPDGEVVQWRAATWESGTLPFLIQDLSARTLRVPAPSEGLGAFASLRSIVIGSDDRARALREWQALLGGEAVDLGFSTPRGRIEFAAAAADGVIERVVLEVLPRDDADRALVESATRRGRALPEGGVEMNRDDAAGARLILVGP